MENIIYIGVGILGLYFLYRSYRKYVTNEREELIDNFRFPATIEKKIIEKYPHLNEKQAQLVIDGLREYFHLCNIAGRKMVSMPSQVVDVAWHEFILFTLKYKNFCQDAFGRFLHHTPAEAMRSPTQAQDGIKRAWKISCFRENMSPDSAPVLPVLFAIDADLNIPDGFKYSLDCNKPGSHKYCAGDIGCGSGCGSGCSSSDSSGCGGCGGD
ncbi:MAG: hypothetical protein HWE27_03245 [Gammaproteobacteria bacterium]|nr:hypothetical protein [Gammaproteobacteria bacterium]